MAWPLIIAGVMAGVSAYGASSSNKQSKKAAQAQNARSQAAAKSTRETNISITRAQSIQQREKISRDTNLLLGQLVVSAAERNVLESQSTDQGIQTIVQGMLYNLSQVDMNQYLTEQSILAQTQYPEFYTAPQQNVWMAGLMGGFQGYSMGAQISQGLQGLNTPRTTSQPTGPAYSGYTSSGTPQWSFSNTPSNPVPSGMQFGGPRLA